MSPFPVGLKPSNPWVLYELHGGIDEFCPGIFYPTHEGAPNNGRARLTGGGEGLRVNRGGSWYDLVIHCESAARNEYPQDTPSEDRGFRVLVEG